MVYFKTSGSNMELRGIRGSSWISGTKCRLFQIYVQPASPNEVVSEWNFRFLAAVFTTLARKGKFSVSNLYCQQIRGSHEFLWLNRSHFDSRPLDPNRATKNNGKSHLVMTRYF